MVRNNDKQASNLTGRHCELCGTVETVASKLDDTLKGLPLCRSCSSGMLGTSKTSFAASGRAAEARAVKSRKSKWTTSPLFGANKKWPPLESFPSIRSEVSLVS